MRILRPCVVDLWQQVPFVKVLRAAGEQISPRLSISVTSISLRVAQSIPSTACLCRDDNVEEKRKRRRKKMW